MNLTIQTLFTDPQIVKAVIDRVLQMRLDTIYWKQYGDFLETKTRVFKTYGNGYWRCCRFYYWQE